jgi:hypothetical protein
MKVKDYIVFATQLSSELAARQASAVGVEVGQITAIETRDGVPYVNVSFPYYNGEFSGVLASDIEIVEKYVEPVKEPTDD